MKSFHMAVAIYEDHGSADAALAAFLNSSFDLCQLSVVGKEHRRDPGAEVHRHSATPTPNCGKFGTFWVAGPLAAAVIRGLKVAAPMTELNALGVGLFMQGLPLEAAAEYEAAVKADTCLFPSLSRSPRAAHRGRRLSSLRNSLQGTGPIRQIVHLPLVCSFVNEVSRRQRSLQGVS